MLLEAEFRSLKSEWLDFYEKAYRLAGRLDSARRWTGEKTAPGSTKEPAIAPENGPEPPNSPPEPPVAKMSRSELLKSLTG